MSITVGDKEVREVIYSQQFHVRYGETFSFTFQHDGKTVTVQLTQKIYKPILNVTPFTNNESPYIDFNEKESSDSLLCYVLHNFNQIKITTNPIPFYTAKPSGYYCFQLSAVCISDELDNPETYWLYSVTIYKENAECLTVKH